MPISTFQAALEIHGVKADADEVECMVANMIFRVRLLSQSPKASREAISTPHRRRALTRRT